MQMLGSTSHSLAESLLDRWYGSDLAPAAAPAKCCYPRSSRHVTGTRGQTGLPCFSARIDASQPPLQWAATREATLQPNAAADGSGARPLTLNEWHGG